MQSSEQDLAEAERRANEVAQSLLAMEKQEETNIKHKKKKVCAHRDCIHALFCFIRNCANFSS
jgi:hypothetical protein